ALGALASQEFDPRFDRDVWKAEFGLLRRGQQTSGKAIRASLETANLQLLGWLVQMHAQGTVALPPSIAKTIRVCVAKGERDAGYFANMVAHPTKAPMFRAFVRDLEL